MHPYATDSYERIRVTAMLVVTSILIGSATSEITSALSWWGQWYWDFSGVAWFLLLYWLADQYFWRIPWLHLPFLFQLPDLRGEWRGELRSSWSDFGDAMPCRLVVQQSWTTMHVEFCLEERTSGSHSVAAALLLDYQGQPTLRYEYLNDPTEDQRDVLDRHGGTTQLVLKREGYCQLLDGRYYTDRLTQTRGTIVVRKAA